PRFDGGNYDRRIRSQSPSKRRCNIYLGCPATNSTNVAKAWGEAEARPVQGGFAERNRRRTPRLGDIENFISRHKGLSQITVAETLSYHPSNILEWRNVRQLSAQVYGRNAMKLGERAVYLSHSRNRCSSRFRHCCCLDVILASVLSFVLLSARIVDTAVR